MHEMLKGEDIQHLLSLIAARFPSNKIEISDSAKLMIDGQELDVSWLSVRNDAIDMLRKGELKSEHDIIDLIVFKIYESLGVNNNTEWN